MMAILRELTEALREVNTRLQEQNRRLAGVEMRGKVAQVDTQKKMARIVIGKDSDGNDVLSPWRPYKQAAGALKFHNPPSVGQVMICRGEGGDIEQGVLEPFWWNDDNQSPSDKDDEHVLTFGNVRIDLKGDGVTATVGGVTYKLTASGLEVDGGHIKNDGVVIDKNHVHIGVEPGAGTTGVPQG